MNVLNETTTAMEKRVRIRTIIDASKDPPIAFYNNGIITAWKWNLRKGKHNLATMKWIGLDDEQELSIHTKMVQFSVGRWC